MGHPKTLEELSTLFLGKGTFVAPKWIDDPRDGPWLTLASENCSWDPQVV